MTRGRQILVLVAIAIIAALLAFPLRDTIYQAVIVPVAYLGWQLGLLYRSLSQGIWWLLIIAVVLMMLGYSLVPTFKPIRRKEPKPRPQRGQVEDLAMWLGRTKHGVYYKWLVANRLGKLAFQILLHRENGRPRSVFAPLLGDDWEPSPDLQSYLETGLHGSFSDFPSKGPRAEPRKTPLDYEIPAAVEFLESKVENDQTSRRR